MDALYSVKFKLFKYIDNQSKEFAYAVLNVLDTPTVKTLKLFLTSLV